jgi:hypothetical protein
VSGHKVIFVVEESRTTRADGEPSVFGMIDEVSRLSVAEVSGLVMGISGTKAGMVEVCTTSWGMGLNVKPSVWEDMSGESPTPSSPLWLSSSLAKSATTVALSSYLVMV